MGSAIFRWELLEIRKAQLSVCFRLPIQTTVAVVIYVCLYFQTINYAVIKILSYDVAVVFNDVAIPWIEVFTFLRRSLVGFGFTWPLIGC